MPGRGRFWFCRELILRHAPLPVHLAVSGPAALYRTRHLAHLAAEGNNSGSLGPLEKDAHTDLNP
jgi:hypothetical protein